MIPFRVALVACVIAWSSACAEKPEQIATPVAGELVLVETDGQWKDLLHPTGIRTGGDGRVFVADQGDKMINIFDRSGSSVGEVGGEGSGPGEFRSIQDFALTPDHIIALDPALGRLVWLDRQGNPVKTLPETGAALFSVLGPDRLVLANNPAWSLPAPTRNGPGPLFQITNSAGEVIETVGPRSRVESPFASHIINFFLPAGTRDGSLLWIAHLNDPTIDLYSSGGAHIRSIERTLPFDWRRIPANHTPKMVGGEERPGLPFDPVSLGIAVDARNRAYILTAVAPLSEDNKPTAVAVDIVRPTDSTVTRYEVPTPATHIAVSPDGHRIYLLHEPTAMIRVYTRPGQ